jgi:hypothetical protein
MSMRLQFAGCLVALGISAMAGAPCLAQGARANWAQNRQDNKPPKQQSQPPRQQPPRQQPPRHQPPREQPRQEQRREQRQQPQEARRAQNDRQNAGANRPPNMNRAETATRPNNNPNRPPTAYTPPPRRDFNSLNPQERQKVLEDNRRLQKLPPAQRQELQERAQVWNKLTPDQRQHIRNDVLPRWQQMPSDRKRAIQQRLGVLKNMPETARNQHLNDPNFTRGMSEEDKATLRDLSHLHVGGAPDPPNE